jgi:disulfide bond formation protein DsbB
MSTWLYIRVAIIAFCFITGFIGTGRELETGYPLLYMAAYVFAFGVVGMLFVIGIQAFNSRSATVWSYPSWNHNPFTLREPLQFFNFGAHFMIASGLGGLLHVAYDRTTPIVEPVVLAVWGIGMLVGVRLCTLVFRHKMLRT